MSRKRKAAVAASLTAVLVAGSISLLATPASAASWSDAANKTASNLPVKETAYTNNGIRVANGVNPPTNSWISGAAFVGDGTYKPTFTGSVAFKSTDKSFSVFMPKIVATAKTVFGMWSDDNAVKLSPAGATSYEISRVDDLSADLTYKNGSNKLGVMTSAEGWPYVQYVATSAQNLSIAAPNSVTKITGGYTFKDNNGTVYRVITSAPLTGTTLALTANQSVHVYAVPVAATTADIATLDAGAVKLTSATTGYKIDGDKAVTTFTLGTENNKKTVFAAMPHQSNVTSDGALLSSTYENLQGTMKLSAGNNFTYSVAALDTPLDLDLSTLTAEQKTTLIAQIRKDLPTVTKFDAEGSYFGGKYLERAVQVYRLAKQLNMTTETATLKTAIIGELDKWMDANGCVTGDVKCFTYDNTLKGVVGQKAEYGSDTEFNDHYFHYGYFLYAAGAMALDDPSLVAKYKTVADVLAADIANTQDTATAIERRNFDDYAGHSWASGVSPFQDGNNQESTSEATNAWAGLNLWATASGNTELGTEAQWMFSNEARTAVQYWLDPKDRDGFTSPHIALLWGGKADYATWFSGAASATTGIQVIPAAPAHIAYFKSVGKEQLKTLSDSVFGVNNDNVSGQPLVDWDVALTAMYDPARAELLYGKLKDSDIDNGNTRSYLYALIHASGTVESAPTIPVDPTVPTEPTTPTTPPVVEPTNPPVTPVEPPVTSEPTTPPTGTASASGELVDAVDGDHAVAAGTNVVQKLTYRNLLVGSDYTIVTELFDTVTGTPIAGMVKDKVFRPTTKDGEVSLTVTYNDSLKGKKVVAHTRLLGPGGAVIANLNSSTDTKQTVVYGGGSTTPPVVTVPTTPPVVPTPEPTVPVTPPVTVPSGSPAFTSKLVDSTDGDHTVKNNGTINQVVTYQNLSAGNDYVIIVELMDPKTGAFLGVVKDKVFRATAKDGSTTLSITDTKTLNGKAVFGKVRLLGPAGAEFKNITSDLNTAQQVKFN